MDLLIDTDVLIDHLRGRIEARQYLMACVRRADRLLCCAITHAELLSGMKPSEERDTRSLLAALSPVPVDEAVAEMAGRYRRQFAKSHGLMLPDALVAGAARKMAATLVTRNVKHYPMKDLSILAPY